jgi:hypothetical protein
VAPKPPGSDNVFSNNVITSLTQQSTVNQIYPTVTTTTLIINDIVEDRSIKETASTNTQSKAGLIASIVAPTGILGVIGAAVGAFFYKKNQTNASTNDTGGFFSNLFSGNSNAIVQNKSELNSS